MPHLLAGVLAAVLPLIVGAADLPYGHPDFVPTPERPVGWRGGTGSGWYPGATTVTTAWNDAPQRGIVYRVPLPYLSAASPIIVGDRLFTTAEPDDLICIEASTGKILWQRSSNPILEKQTPEAQAQARATHAKFVRLSREWSYAGKPVECTFAFPKEKEGVPESATTWLAGQTALLAELGLTGTDLPVLARRFYQERNQESRSHGLMAPNGWTLWYGGTMPTPVSDGTHVWTKFANGALVCYDLQGQRRWLTDRSLRRGHGDVSSLALAGGTLLDHDPDANGTLVAYDAATGRERWRVKADKGAWAAGSPLAARIGSTWVALTAGGDVVRVADGTALLSKRWDSFTGSSPIIHDGVVYSCNMAKGTEGSIGAVRLSAGADGAVGGQTAWWWTKWWRGNKGFTSTEGLAIDQPMPGAGRGSPAYGQGTLFLVGGTGGLELTVVDAASGQPVAQDKGTVRVVQFSSTRGEEVKRLGITAGRETCVSATVAAGHLILGYSAVPRSLFVVYRIGAGGKLQEVARNTVEGLTVGTPFVQGDRMYIRTFDFLYCIGDPARPYHPPRGR